MMKNFFKEQKGINLVTLSITIVVILILTNIILYNVKDNLGIQNLKNMQVDIENLRDKISIYYTQYGQIPANTDMEYTNISGIRAYGMLNKEDENGKFYVIDLSVIDNLTLNYGKEYEDYKKIISDETTTEMLKKETINKLQDIYIINNNTHNIFYVKGIKIDGELFYTDYTKEDVDKKEIKLEEISEIDNNWSPIYDKTEIYKDENGDKAYIPEGFQVSRTIGQNIINKGLVVREGTEGSEFVWIPVATVISDTEENATKNKAIAIQDGENYKGLLYDFTERTSTVKKECTTSIYTNREPDIVSDTNIESYDNKIITRDSLQNEYNAMIESVKKYGGFYVGRYETSLSDADEATIGVKGSVQSKPGILPTSSENTATNMWYGLYDIEKTYTGTNNSVQSSMIWGSQYDAMLNWIQSSNSEDKNKITMIGNGNHNRYLETSGNSGDSINNICDLEGNLYEWSLEANGNIYRVMRGGNFYDSKSPIERTHGSPYVVESLVGSRITLYIQK